MADGGMDIEFDQPGHLGTPKALFKTDFPTGTPEPPFQPPRRRSSLAFSRVVPSRKSAIPALEAQENSPYPIAPTSRNEIDVADLVFDNTGNTQYISHTTPGANGHVAQMRKLFSSAKASLRIDVRFAASPDGSIASRLPHNAMLEQYRRQSMHDEPLNPGAGTVKNRDWRYSTAPNMLAEPNLDVREPLLDTLPPSIAQEIFDDHDDDDELEDAPCEPVSSGFNSPTGSVGHSQRSVNYPGPKSSLQQDIVQSALTLQNIDQVESRRLSSTIMSDLEQPIRDLEITTSEPPKRFDVTVPEESRLLKGCLVGIDEDDETEFSVASNDEIYISPSAKAAAEYARARRGILSSNSADASLSGSDSRSRTPSDFVAPSTWDTPCPNPAAHLLRELVLCPDPVAHYPMRTPEPGLVPPNHSGSSRTTVSASLQPARLNVPLKNRVTASGSPMPLLREQSFTPSPIAINRSEPLCRKSTSRTQNSSSRTGQPVQRPVLISRATEHFQPGWYYSKESDRPPNTSLNYSFSTAAAKVVGSSAAPDSRIRDSYRTDTLTTLVKPQNRFRKTGIGASVPHRGITKYYSHGNSYNKSRQRQYNPSSTRPGYDTGEVMFRSSPPRSLHDSFASEYTSRRARDLEEQELQPRHGHQYLHPMENIGQESSRDCGLPFLSERSIQVSRSVSVRTQTLAQRLPFNRRRQGLAMISPNLQASNQRIGTLASDEKISQSARSSQVLHEVTRLSILQGSNSNHRSLVKQVSVLGDGTESARSMKYQDMESILDGDVNMQMLDADEEDEIHGLEEIPGRSSVNSSRKENSLELGMRDASPA